MIPNISFLKNKNILALSGNVIISAFSLITMSLLYRSLTKSDAGTWFFFLGVQSLLEAFRGGFLSTSTIKFYSGISKERVQVVLGLIWLIALGITGFFCIASGISCFLLPYIENYQIQIVIKWIGLTFISSLPFTVPIWILMAEENYTKILWLRLVNSISMFLIIVILIYVNKMTLNNMLILNIVTNFLTGLFSYFARILHLKSIVKYTRSTLMELIHFGKYTVSSSISNIFFRTFNTFIITFFLGPTALAIYNLPGRLMTIIEIPLGSSLGTGMSSMATALNKNDEVEFLAIFKKYAGLLTFAILPIVLFVILFADTAVSIIGGPKYVGTEAANILRLMVFFSLLFPIDRFNGVALDMLHLPHINLQKILVMLGINIIAGGLGIYLFNSLYGIAFFSPLTGISGVLFGYFALRKRLDYTIKDILVVGWGEVNFYFKEFSSMFNKSR